VSEAEQTRRAPERPDDETPEPQPEPGERRLDDPGPTELSKRDYLAVAKRAAKAASDDDIMVYAGSIAYSTFLALPAILLLTIGVFSVFAGEDAVERIIERVEPVAPEEATTLLRDSLERTAEGGGGGFMILIGGALALWTATGAMITIQKGLNVAYGREESRGFLRQRLAALAMLVFALLAFVLVFGLLVLGPLLSTWIGSAIGLEGTFEWVWWTVQWPILIGGLLLAFAAILYFGPNVEHPKWSFLTFGAVVAVVIWIVASGLFALYVGNFGSYDETWGSIAAGIIMLVWLWLSGLVLLFGAEINAEAERSRELREGQPAEREIQAPAKA
jgi:membrane protein